MSALSFDLNSGFLNCVSFPARAMDISDLDRGTKFVIHLPLMEKLTEKMPSDIGKEHQSGNERILLVEDEEPVTRLEKQLLKRLGYQVTVRINSLEALEAFKANPEAYDLVITDMTMPNMTGGSLARGLDSIKPGIPVIICNGFSDRMNREKAAAAGIKGFLIKPIVRSDMAQIVRKVLDEAKNGILY